VRRTGLGFAGLSLLVPRLCLGTRAREAPPRAPGTCEGLPRPIEGKTGW
jgi:hypothetical protein